jgi:hypothetical protein
MIDAEAPRPDLSLVIPVYNERDNLRPLWEQIRAALAPAGRPYEVLLIDDGSTDGSSEAMDALAREHPGGAAGPFREERRAERGLRGGIPSGARPDRRHARRGPAERSRGHPALVGKLESSGAGAVVGIRAGRQDSLVRKVSSRVGNWVRNTLTHDHVTDTGCSLKAYRKEAVMKIKMYRGMHRFLPTLIRTEGYEVLEMPVRHRERIHGASKYGIANRALSGLADVLAVRWMRSRAIHYRIRGEAPSPERRRRRRLPGAARGDVSRPDTAGSRPRKGLRDERSLLEPLRTLSSRFLGVRRLRGSGALHRPLLRPVARFGEEKESVMPVAFWYFSIIGGSISLIYAIAIGSLPFSLGQATGLVIYARNLQLIRRKAASLQQIPAD